jgi:hypothetical protein
MMKNLIITTLLLSSVLSAQTGIDTSTYHDDPNFTPTEIVKTMEIAGFKPVKRTKDLREFKILMLMLSRSIYTQVNIDTWYNCTYNQETIQMLYNTYYKSVSPSFFQRHCKALNALMIIDGTSPSRR